MTSNDQPAAPQLVECPHCGTQNEPVPKDGINLHCKQCGNFIARITPHVPQRP